MRRTFIRTKESLKDALLNSDSPIAHGAGFLDRYYEHKETLIKCAKQLGEKVLFLVGDTIHIS